MNKPVVTILLSATGALSFGQSSPNLYDFTQANDITVIQNNDSLPNPWAGGLNYGQVSTIDLNMDNIDDLVIYDRHTGQVETFISAGGTYKYAPEYREKFPTPLSWMLLRDYDCDGKKDIFYNDASNVRVWQNTSSGGILEFTDATNGSSLGTLYRNTSSKSPLYISSGDVPGIADVDNDGDLDILTFENGGVIMEYHENKANCGLDFEVEERCWGHFTESGVYRSLSLNSCVPFKKKTLHSGSTILPIDLDGDTDQDLILGNISYHDMVAAYNGGNLDSAHFTSQDTLFPKYDIPINIYQFPVAFYEDVTFDGIPDLIVSPADQGDGSVDRKSTIVYKNTGTASVPVFQYEHNDFVQKTMIDLGKGAVPRLVDLNGDSLQDLVVANNHAFVSPTSSKHFYHYYQNSGTASEPRFSLVDSNFANISSYSGLEMGSIPCFGDLDGDGDQDMIVGNQEGKLYYFKNSSATQPNFTFQSAFANIDVDNNAAPFLYDMDQDGDLDLLVGNEGGKVHYFTNFSPTSPSFTLVSEDYGGVNVKKGSGGGNSIPYVFEENGLTNLFVGSENNGIFQYDSLSSVGSLPPSKQVTVGSGTLVPGGADQTPFGIIQKSGRNQFLIKASELKNSGLVYGYLRSLAFDVTTSSNANVYPKYSLKLKLTKDTALTDFVTGLTEVNSDNVLFLGQGWNAFAFNKDFLWDGESNIIVEFCYSETAGVGNNILVNMTNVGYDCNAFGTYVDRYNGCSQVLKGTSQNRPNVMFDQVPAFRETSRYGRARRSAPAVADLNNDGYVDMILGNFGGGLYYYKGKEYQVSLPENALLAKESKLNVFPNPGTGSYTIAAPNESASTLRVFDLTGRMVLNQEISDKETLVDLNAQAAGIYIFILQTPSGVKTQKVIKQ